MQTHGLHFVHSEWPTNALHGQWRRLFKGLVLEAAIVPHCSADATAAAADAAANAVLHGKESKLIVRSKGVGYSKLKLKLKPTHRPTLYPPTCKTENKHVCN